MHSARLSGFADFVLTNHIDDQEVAQMASNSKSHNVHTLTGNLGADPITGVNDKGPWTKISVADDSLGKDQETVWVDIFARSEGEGAAWVQHLRSGSYVTATGQLEMEIFTSRATGRPALGATLKFAQVTFGPKGAADKQA